MLVVRTDGSFSDDLRVLAALEPAVNWQRGDRPSEAEVVCVEVEDDTAYLSTRRARDGLGLYLRLGPGTRAAVAHDPGCGVASDQHYDAPR